ncbi:hypothetical protein CAPTEDRAFT_101416, partial [Capitella teleta]
NEISIFHYDYESKRESMEWRHHGSPPPQNVKVSRTTKKSYDASFLGFQRKDSRGLCGEMNYHQRCIPCARLLENVHTAIKEKRRGLLARGQRLQEDNSPSHNSHIAVASGRKGGFEILSQSLYSPDLTLSDNKSNGNPKNIQMTSFCH